MKTDFKYWISTVQVWMEKAPRMEIVMTLTSQWKFIYLSICIYFLFIYLFTCLFVFAFIYLFVYFYFLFLFYYSSRHLFVRLLCYQFIFNMSWMTVNLHQHKTSDIVIMLTFNIKMLWYKKMFWYNLVCFVFFQLTWLQLCLQCISTCPPLMSFWIWSSLLWQLFTPCVNGSVSPPATFIDTKY